MSYKHTSSKESKNILKQNVWSYKFDEESETRRNIIVKYLNSNSPPSIHPTNNINKISYKISPKIGPKTSRKILPSRYNLSNNRVLYARKSGEESLHTLMLDGEKISLSTATALKELIWGSCNNSPRTEWINKGISFHSPDSLLSYGLKTLPNGTKNFLICLQACCLKHYLFENKIKGSNQAKSFSNEPELGRRKTGHLSAGLLKPNEKLQNEMLVGGLSSLLIKISENSGGIFCLPGSENCFEPVASYSMDGVTEKLHLFKCETEESLKTIIKRYVSQLLYDQGQGLISILYSLILSRGIDRLKLDLQDYVNNSLIESNGDCSQALLNLIIVGSGTPYLHNGIICGTEDKQSCEQRGVLRRNEIGVLIWENNCHNTEQYNVGSRLKTPLLPIWITKCNGRYGVLFNPNRELMKSHQAERRFQLYYYSDRIFKKDESIKETILTISNNGTQSFQDSKTTEFDEIEESLLELAIKTKWSDAEIDWNGMSPYV